MEIGGLILLVVCFVLMAALNKGHREQTGVDMPSRGAMRNIRRNARKKGTSEEAAYTAWLLKEQARASKRKA